MLRIRFSRPRHRCYISSGKRMDGEKKKESKQTQYEIELVDDEDAWAALDEAEGRTEDSSVGLANAGEGRKNEIQSSVQLTTRKKWLPKGMEPVLEELPKWGLLADVLQEIEEEVVRLMSSKSSLIPGTDTVLVMCSNQRTCEVLSDYLSSLDRRSPRGKWGGRTMERRLRLYLWWKAKLNADRNEGVETFRMPGLRNEEVNLASRALGADGNAAPGVQKGLSEALKRKDALMREKSMSRRRVRGGTPGLVKGSRSSDGEANNEMRAEADDIADFLSSQKGVFNVLDNDEGDDVLREGTEPFDNPLQRPTINVDEEIVASMASDENDDDFDSDYGLLTPEQTVLFRVYSDDTDDQVLDEIKPRFIIMYEPIQDFIRRIECYRSSNPGLAVRVYFMVYQYSCEEHKFLAGIRREKEAFERLIKERGNMVVTLTEGRRTGSTSEDIIKTISTRIAGGKQVATMPSQVIVDMREFRSTLPSLLHASKLLVIPATLTVGDYILAPDICVERKSIPDLVQSFSSGRLYTQCELMSVHYKQPILLIEFEEHKSFSLDMRLPTYVTLAALANTIVLDCRQDEVLRKIHGKISCKEKTDRTSL
ncbi:hypothetical protein M0805_005239 [Coniferiporia weirii]|nr:hypothetical protein M0805_005239 [Coniferiporia weirii]